jgi:hypothetical protein
MLTSSTRLRLQEIIGRIGNGDPVSLADRIYVQKFADRDASVASWLRKAQRHSVQGPSANGLDQFLAAMDIGEPDPSSGFRPESDDIGDWFSGAPHWLRRS